ncbi:hypothetical protein BSL78_24063 [Apostichopus japonicus]|uniref:RING-CH-type domain-containing protein n=1 Tax=Stichopus japonicus TaxID=307972 RepID=A0A2G8JTR8_STIJA|nr:hypothetical protein BSL78_24063 [Apostichopus japonicus]
MTSTCVCHKNPAPVRSDSEVYRGGHKMCDNATQTRSAISISSPKVNITEYNAVSHPLTTTKHRLLVEQGVQTAARETVPAPTAANCGPSFVKPTNLYLVPPVLNIPCHSIRQDCQSDQLPLLTQSDMDTTLKVERLPKSFSLMSCERMVKNFLGTKCKLGQSVAPAVDENPSVSDSLSFSTITSEGPICRICHEGDQGGKLVQPCRCCGTLSYTHQKCLEKWLQTKNGDVCELCQYQFHTRRKDRPFTEWLQAPSRPRDRRNIIMDILCFCLLTPMVFTSAWLCLHGAHYYLTYFDNRDLEGMGLIILASVLLIIFLFWSAVSLRYHCSIWNVWRRENQLVHIVVADTDKGIGSSHGVSSSHRSNSQSVSSHSSYSIAKPEEKMDINGNFVWLPKMPPGAAFV